jgi:hypothetical protein
LPLLLLANKQDSPTSLSVQEIRESFDAWTRAHPERRRAALESANDEEVTEADRKGKGKEVERADGWDNDGAVEERMASLDVLGVSALEGWVKCHVGEWGAGSRLMIERGYERQLIGYTYVYKMPEKCEFYNDVSNWWIVKIDFNEYNYPVQYYKIFNNKRSAQFRWR